MKKAKILIHIGYHKTSTTWLQKFLFNNTEIGFVLPCRNSEILPILVFPHAFDFDPHACKTYFQPVICKAQDYGLIPVLSCEELSGNPHSGGYASKELADRLKTVFSDAKILIIIRDQVSMIISTYKQYVKVGGTSPLVNYLQPPMCGRQRIPLFDWDHFKYHRLIKYYLELFGHSQVLVLPYEFFLNNPVKFISRIIQFCERDINIERIESLPYEIKANESLSAISLALKRRVNRIVSHRDRLNQGALIPVSLPMSCQKLKLYWQFWDSITPQSLKKASDNQLEIRVRKLVGERYKQSNAYLSAMLNLDLRQYRYDL